MDFAFISTPPMKVKWGIRFVDLMGGILSF